MKEMKESFEVEFLKKMSEVFNLSMHKFLDTLTVKLQTKKASSEAMIDKLEGYVTKETHSVSVHSTLSLNDLRDDMATYE